MPSHPAPPTLHNQRQQQQKQQREHRLRLHLPGNKRPTHSHLLTSGAKQMFNSSGLRHPQQTFTERLRQAEEHVAASPPGAGAAAAPTSEREEPRRAHRPHVARRHTS